MEITLKDERLGKRWRILVRAQRKVSSPLAATPAAWRFDNNQQRVTLAELVEPLREYARERVAQSSARFVWVAQDWSKLNFPGHGFRRDLAELSSRSDVGDEVTAALAISGDNGAPLELHLTTNRASCWPNGCC